jgi:hypothetical protein
MSGELPFMKTDNLLIALAEPYASDEILLRESYTRCCVMIILIALGKLSGT